MRLPFVLALFAIGASATSCTEGPPSAAASAGSAATSSAIASTSPSATGSVSAARARPRASVDAVEAQGSADPYAEELSGDDGKEELGETEALASPFPHACASCDATRPLVKLMDRDLVAAVRAYDCAAGTDHAYVPFFPGIQGFNDGKVAGPKTRLAGDTATANLYVKYASRSTDEGSTSDVQGWSLLFYYNAPRVVEDAPTTPVFVSPHAGSKDRRGVRVFSRENHSWLRLKDHGDESAREGDQVEARLLGIWASTPSDEDFSNGTPVFTAEGELAARDKTDFEAFVGESVENAAFRNFVYRAAYEVAIAYKCDQPVFAHSGGGAVVTFVSRLLAVSELKDDMKKWDHDFRVIGLEAVLSNEMNAKLHDTLGHLVMKQFVVGHSGSKTYANVIVPEAAECKFTALSHASVTEKVNPPGWNGDGGGHGGLGFYALANGRLPGFPPFVKK